MCVIFSTTIRVLRRFWEDRNNRRGRTRINGIRFFWKVSHRRFSANNTAYQRGVKMGEPIARWRLKQVRNFPSKSPGSHKPLERRLNIQRGTPRCFGKSQQWQTIATRPTNRAWAMTLPKLSLKILINEVISRMFVMHTKMSWPIVSKILTGIRLLVYHERRAKMRRDLRWFSRGVIKNRRWGS